MASDSHAKRPIVVERRKEKGRKKTPRLTKTYDVKIIPATVGVVAETEEPPKKRVAAYCRVSTDQEAQETSLEEQMAHFNTVIAEHPDWELAGIYADEGISGTQVKHRVQFQQMIEDVICHGAPSPALWKKYAIYQEQTNGGKLKGINFRCKDDSWTDFGMKEICKSIPDDETKKLYISKDKDAYMQMFLRDYCLRPSCYECAAKKVKMSDLTIADFWGINDVAPDMNDGMGTSLVLIRTEKGKDVFEKISSSMKLKEVSYKDGVRGNPAEYKACARPMQRNTFFDDMQNMSFEELKQKYAAPIKVSFITKVKRKAKIAIKKVLRVIGGGQSINTVKNMDYSLCFVFDCQEKINERATNTL